MEVIMSLTWKDAVATLGAVLVTGVVIALLSGVGGLIDERWIYASVIIFAIAGFTALITGTAYLMNRAWTSVTTYALAAVVVFITAANIFLNSQEWFIALAVVIGLMWLEFVLVHLFSAAPTAHHHTPSSRGAAI